MLAPNDKIRLGDAMSHIMTFRSDDEFTMMVGTTGKVTAAGVVTSTPHTRGSSVNVAALLEISKALNSSLHLKDVLEKVIDAVMALTKAERGLLLLGRSADALNIEVRRGEEGTGNESQFSRSVVGAVFETGEAQILTDIAGDERFNAQQSIVGLQLRTVMCVPLRLSHFGQDIEDDDLEPYQTDASNPGAGANKTRILGVVYVDRRSPTNHFNDEDLQVFESMTGHAAIAIDNARLYEEALEKRRLDEDLQVASRIQQSLLLSDFPDLPWADVHAMNLAARVVGGDYYEFFDAPSGALGFAVGDVSGKGFPAAMLMSTLQAAFLATASTSEDLAAICAQLNQFVVKRTSPERYATFFVGLLSEDGHVRYVNCGHNPAIHLSSAEPATLMGGGLPIGLFPIARTRFRSCNWRAATRW